MSTAAVAGFRHAEDEDEGDDDAASEGRTEHGTRHVLQSDVQTDARNRLEHMDRCGKTISTQQTAHSRQSAN
jgi:hypothetical protein